MQGRRIARVPISFEALVKIMTNGWEAKHTKCVKGLPDGAEFVGSTFDIDRLVVYLYFSHKDFQLVAEGSPIPNLEVIHAMKTE